MLPQGEGTRIHIQLVLILALPRITIPRGIFTSDLPLLLDLIAILHRVVTGAMNLSTVYIQIVTCLQLPTGAPTAGQLPTRTAIHNNIHIKAYEDMVLTTSADLGILYHNPTVES